MSAQLKLKPQTVQPAKTSLGKPAYASDIVYVDPEIVAGLQPYNEVITVYQFEVNPSQLTQSISWMPLGVTTVSLDQAQQIDASNYIHALSEKLCEIHPSISTYEGIFGGLPHLKGLRLSVADILAQLYLAGSIEAVQKIYSPDVSEDQIKEAIAYAQDFLESALSSSP